MSTQELLAERLSDLGGSNRVLHEAGQHGGKPAGVRCILFGKPERPAVCVSLRPTESMCGLSQAVAMDSLEKMEIQTAPERARSSIDQLCH